MNLKKGGHQLYLKCQDCGTFFEYAGGVRKAYCSDVCKLRAWRRRQKS